MKKVLIIAYYFPPDSKVGGIRPAKFAKYLTEFGWESHILSIKDKYIENPEYTRLDEVKSITITRTSILPTAMDILLYLKRLVRPPTTNDNSTHLATNQDEKVLSNNKHGSLLKRSLNSLLELPDKQVGWFLPAVWAGVKIVRQEKIDIILTTSPPITDSLIGLAISYLTGAKLVTDLRDPIPLHTAKAPSHQTWLSNKIEAWLEKKIYQKSALVISATKKHTSFFINHFGDKYPNKFHTIWNGFDSSDFDDISAAPKIANKKFTINYLGSFYASRSPSYFLQALHNLITQKLIPENEIDIHFIGNVEQTSEGKTIDLIKKHQLHQTVHIQGQIPYKEALNKMREADVLLLIAPDDMNLYAVPAKTFEYMYANNNILCLSSNSPTSQLIQDVECGKVADVFSVEEIAECIKQFFLEWKANELQTDNSKIAKFERKNQTKELAKLLNTL